MAKTQADLTNNLTKTYTRCGKKHLGTVIKLELNSRTNHYATPGTVPECESQGLFPFGKTCAYRALCYDQYDSPNEISKEKQS